MNDWVCPVCEAVLAFDEVHDHKVGHLAKVLGSFPERYGPLSARTPAFELALASHVLERHTLVHLLNPGGNWDATIPADYLREAIQDALAARSLIQRYNAVVWESFMWAVRDNELYFEVLAVQRKYHDIVERMRVATESLEENLLGASAAALELAARRRMRRRTMRDSGV